jgi:hypothetical protein
MAVRAEPEDEMTTHDTFSRESGGIERHANWCRLYLALAIAGLLGALAWISLPFI